MNILLIGLGGALGAILRYLTSEAITRNFTAATRFPLATFFVNVFGCFIAGIIYYFIIKNFVQFDARLKNFLLIGLLGGFTTFSAFSLDFFRLATAGQNLQAVVYALSSVIISIAALFFGFYSAKLLFS